MLINLRNALMAGKRTPTAKDYVQSGLVAMWDGIENAGWGVHDANATTWKDLIGGNDFTLTNCSIVSDGVSFQGYTSTAVAPTPIASVVNVPSCVEIVCERTNSTSELCIIAFQATGAMVTNFIYLYQGKVAYAHGSLENTTSCAAESEVSWQPRSMTFNYPSSVFINGQPQVAQTNYDFFSTNVTGGVVINPRTNYAFAGVMKAIRYYSRALTASEIAANYAIDKARFGLT